MANRCFVDSLAQVSCQKPFSDEWFDTPQVYPGDYARAIEPDVKGLISPAEARRMSKVLRRAVCTSLAALREAKIAVPDAIVTGTGMGCMENSEKFLADMARYGESCLKPTLFMQSTHNTISSLISILLKCHGYNTTYSHKGISFESALLDARLQIKAGTAGNALVGSHDEVTPLMRRIMKSTRPEYAFVSEASVAAVLTSTPSYRNICEIEEVRLFHRPEPEALTAALDRTADSLLLLGVNGNELNDRPYIDLLDILPFAPRALSYKRIFGDNYSSSALAFYAGARILEHGKIPEQMSWRNGRNFTGSPERITILSHSDMTEWSLIRLGKV